MIEFEQKRKEVKDIGLDESIKKLKPEQIEKAVNAVLNMRGTAGRFKAPLDTCIHCALCSKACHWYHSFGGDPTYTPVAKVRMTLWEMIKRKGKVSPEFIKHCARISFTECNLCRRCRTTAGAHLQTFCASLSQPQMSKYILPLRPFIRT